MASFVAQEQRNLRVWSMNPLAYYLGAVVLLGLSVILIRGTSPQADCGCSSYEKKRVRSLIGKILLVTSALCLGIGLLAQFVSN